MMITWIIIGLTCLVSYAAFKDESVSSKLIFSPYIINRQKGEWFRFVSIGFVHVDAGHLIGNMLTLFFFGKAIEQLFSPAQYLLFYASALVMSAAPVYRKQKDNPAYTAAGASGAVSAIVFATVLYAPWEIILLKFFIPLPFILYAVGYLFYSGYMARRQSDNIGHDAHLWGALYGIAFTLLIHPEVLSRFIGELMHPPFS
jgi:membrane associated rhomboid family serine protease